MAYFATPSKRTGCQRALKLYHRCYLYIQLYELQLCCHLSSIKFRLALTVEYFGQGSEERSSGIGIPEYVQYIYTPIRLLN